MSVARPEAVVSGSAELIVEGGPRPRAIAALRELWAYRGTLRTFAERSVRVKYKQAALGIGWAVLQPLALMAVFAVAFGRFARVPGGGAPYAAFALSALVPWLFLQTGIQFGGRALITDASLMRKVYFPRETAVLGAVLAAGLDLAIGLGLFFVVGPLLGATVSATWLLAPLLAVMLVCLAAGISLTFGALNVYYRDFEYALPFAMQLWLFASPVVYPLSAIPEQWRGLYVALNPAAGVLDGFRRTLALGQMPDAGYLLASGAGIALLLAIGYRVFKSLEPNFADVV